MALNRLKSVTQHFTGTADPPHPFDPLTNAEIEHAVSIIGKEHGKLIYNAVTLREPKKKEMLKWLEAPTTTTLPPRVADIVALAPGGKVYDGLVDLGAEKVVGWELMEGVQPLITMEDLQIVEHVVRKDPGVIEQCRISGIPAEDMHKVYCDRTFPFPNSTLSNIPSLDNWLRPPLRQQRPSATSTDVLPPPYGR